MSRSLIGLFRKEWQQHGKAAWTAVFICFAICALSFALGMYSGDPVVPEFYLGIALYCAFLYISVTAVSIYVIEHEKNTFSFLRNLPVSPLTLAIGKIGFALFATGLVLTANLLCCALFCFLQGTFPSESTIPFLIFGTGIAEIFVWGIFWSTRCRNAVLATLAALFCGGFTVVAILFFVTDLHSGQRVVDETEMFLAIQPFRLAVIMIVGILAGWGALRWFEFSIKDTRKVWIPRNFVFARYPQKVQLPFPALIHQHLRNVSLVYPFGIVCFSILSLACIFMCFGHLDTILNKYLLGIACGIIPMGILVFWGNIFGHDQRNGSFRFLSRLGIHAGKVWWSRMVPATLLYIPVLVCLLACLFTNNGGNFWHIAPIAFAVWLTVLAVGAFFSISCDKQMAGITLTLLLSYCLLVAWMVPFLIFFDSSPLWTTVPIALAFLLASRIRAGYWLREIKTWRSRFVPLLSVFAAILLVFIALPFVRVYSVPYVSWERLNAYLADAPTPYKEQLIQYYTSQREFARLIFSGRILDGMSGDEPGYVSYFTLRLMPWEEARRERTLRLQIVAALVDSGVVLDERAVSLWTYYNRRQNAVDFGSGGICDDFWGNTVSDGMQSLLESKPEEENIVNVIPASPSA